MSAVLSIGKILGKGGHDDNGVVSHQIIYPNVVKISNVWHALFPQRLACAVPLSLRVTPCLPRSLGLVSCRHVGLIVNAPIW